jgi:tetratricopeptide (TPR) repeat protein
MHAAGRPAKATGVAVLLAVIATAGCVSSHRASQLSPQSLSPEEERLTEAMAHYAQGLFYEVEGSAYSSNALMQFAEASRLDPSRVSVNTRAAVSALLQNNPAMAVKVLERSCRAAPKSVDRHLDLATAYQLAGRMVEACRTLQRVLKLDPARQNARLALANILFAQDDDKAALATLRRGVGATSNDAPIMGLAYAHGTRFYYDKKLQRAIPCFEFALHHATPPQHELEALIGGLHENVGNKHKALRYYRLAMRDPGPSPQAFVKTALAELDNSAERALAILAEGERRIPDNTVILIARGQIEASLDRRQAALATFERVLLLAQKSANPKQELTEQFYIQYAVTLERNGQAARSEEILELCIRANPAAATALNYLAYTWAEKSEHLEQALEYVQRALLLEPESGPFLDTLGWIYYRMGRHAEAALQIQRATEFLPEDPTVLEHLGDALAALGCGDDAAAYWRRSLDADPARSTAADRLRAAGIEPHSSLQPASRKKREN